MKQEMSSATALSDDATTKVVAWIMTAAVLLVFAGHMFFFAYQVGATSLEQAFNGGSDAGGFYSDLADMIRQVNSDVQSSTRYFSIICALTSMILLASLVTEWSRDRIVGAAVVIGLVLFPVSAYVFALSTPFSLLMMLSVLALWTAKDKSSSIFRSVISGSFSGAIVLLDASGLGLAVGISFIILSSSKDISNVIAHCIPFGAAIVYALISSSSSALSLNLLSDMEVLFTNDADGLFFSYAMLWTALVFSSIALSFSHMLRQQMGPLLVRRTVLLKVAFMAALFLTVTIQPTPAGRMISFSALLMLGVLACLPLVLWLRWVMPHLRSVLVWILLPVAMYSCFWVILGPIDWAGFPYNQIPATP